MEQNWFRNHFSTFKKLFLFGIWTKLKQNFYKNIPNRNCACHAVNIRKKWLALNKSIKYVHDSQWIVFGINREWNLCKSYQTHNFIIFFLIVFIKNLKFGILTFLICYNIFFSNLISSHSLLKQIAIPMVYFYNY